MQWCCWRGGRSDDGYAGDGSEEPPKLKASFGAGLTFDLKRGKKVLSSVSRGKITLRARKYRFVFKENSSFHNFQLENANRKIIKARRASGRRGS